MTLNKDGNYQRLDSVIYENGLSIIKCLRPFKYDIEQMQQIHIDYMNNYIRINPHLIEIIKDMKQNVVKMFYALETTGTDPRKNGIFKISGLIEVNGAIAERFSYKVQPNPKATIEAEALKRSGVTELDILGYPSMSDVHLAVIAMLGKYVNRFDPKDKIWLVGFNNRGFHDDFFRRWFTQNGDEFFGAWFWPESLDVLVLACQYLGTRRWGMPSFKFPRVAKTLGIEIDESKEFDSEYMLDPLYMVYMITVGLEIEM